MQASDATEGACQRTGLKPASPMPWSATDNRIVFLLLALFAGVVLLIKPQGNFPLNDDWAYILPVEWLTKQGKLHFTDWQFMTLIGQVYLGAIAATAFGFSITGLRLLVLALAALSVILVYIIARLADAPRAWAMAAAGLLFCNPVFLITSASFMTDTPFLAVSLLAIFFFLLWQNQASGIYGLIAWLLVFLACSIRQSAIALAVGFLLFSVLQFGLTRKTILSALLPACLAVACLAAYPKVIEHAVGLPSMYNQPALEAKAFALGLLHLKLGYLWMAAKNLLVAIYYLGLFSIPILPLTFQKERMTSTRHSLTPLFVNVIFASAVTLILIVINRITPVDGNTLFDFGLGVRTLQSSEPAMTAAPVVWWMATFLAILGLLSLRSTLGHVISCIRNKASTGQIGHFKKSYAVMMLAVISVYNLPFLTRGGVWFDRYALLNLALFFLLAAPFIMAGRQVHFRQMAGAAILMAGSLGFSVTATHDYLEWNRQRWAAAAELEDTYGVDFEQIDAGFEYNNYKPRQSGDFHRPPGQVLLENPGAKFRVAFSPLPHHQILKVIECRTWLYGSPSVIFVLRATAI